MKAFEESELQALNHELRNACLALEAILKKMSKACTKYENSLLEDDE